MDQSRTKDGKFQLLDCIFGARTLLTSADSNNENGHPYSVQPGWTQLTLIHQFVCTDTHTHTRKRLMLLDLLLTVQDHLTEKLSWKKATEIGRKVDEFHCLRMTLLVTFVKLHTQKPRDTLVFLCIPSLVMFRFQDSNPCFSHTLRLLFTAPVNSAFLH